MFHMTPQPPPLMNEPFIVEVWGRIAGVVLKEGDAFRFHAVSPPFQALDGAAFAKPGLARLAAAQVNRAQVSDGRYADRSLGNANQRDSNVPS
ncbi:MAG: hypothetical protein ACOY4R_09610 [Pseudomonadota bacterium]